MPAAGLPKQTYRGMLTLHMNGEEIQLIAIPRAHTDGDTMVYFPGLDVIMTGDFYRSIQYPNVDRANGGSLQGLLDGLGAVIGHAGPNTKIIPGHGPTVDRTAVMAHRDIAMTVRDRVARWSIRGRAKTKSWRPRSPPTWTRNPGAGTTGERFVRQVYAELKSAR